MSDTFPMNYSIAWVAGIAIVLVLMIAALVSLYNSRSKMDKLHLLLWVVVIIVFPLLGSLAWFVLKNTFVVTGENT